MGTIAAALIALYSSRIALNYQFSRWAHRVAQIVRDLCLQNGYHSLKILNLEAESFNYYSGH